MAITSGASPSRRAPIPRDVLAYLLLTFLLSWAIEVPLALQARGLMQPVIPLWMHYLASFGPLLAACAVTLATRGAAGVSRLLSGLSRVRARPVYWIVAAAAPCAVFALILLAGRLTHGAWPDLSALGRPDDLPPLGIVPTLLLWMITFGLGEEVGWRGFALPRLQSARSAFAASLTLGFFWAAWHLPALFYRDTYLEMGLMVIPMLLTVAAVGSTTFTWLYNGTRGSLLIPVILHGLFDFFSTFPGGVIAPGMVMTVLMAFWAVRVYRMHGPATLCSGEKVIS